MFNFRKKDNGNADLKATLSLVLVLITIVATGLLHYHQTGFGKGAVTIGDGVVVEVDIAASTATREKGLSGRESLRDDEGVLFLFPAAGEYTFWMKDMNFPLDVVWINDGEIVDLTVGVQPNDSQGEVSLFSPVNPADAVLEVNAGFIAKHGLRLGLPVEMDIDRRGALR